MKEADDKSRNNGAGEVTGASLATGGGGGGGGGDAVEMLLNNNHVIQEEGDVSEVKLEVNMPFLLRRKSPTNSAVATAAATETTDEDDVTRTRRSILMLDSEAHIRHRVPSTTTGTANSTAANQALALALGSEGGWEQSTLTHTNGNTMNRAPIPLPDGKPSGGKRSTSNFCNRILRAILKFLVKYKERYVQQYKGYNLSTFGKDCIAGVTVAIMAVPLGMSYAKLAGLPAHYGIYASFVPPMIYPLVGGTSRQLAVGPAALISLLVREGLEKIMLNNPSTAEEAEAAGFVTEDGNDAVSLFHDARYQQLAMQCSFLVGILNIAMGLFQLGFMTQFLSRAVISGFCSGASIIIASSQVKHLFGYNIPNANKIHDIIKNLAASIDQFNPQTFAMGAMCICILVAIKFVSQHPTIAARYPFIKWIRALGPIAVSGMGILLVVFLDLEEEGIPIVGNIPPGLPSITVDQWFPLSSELWVRREDCLCVYLLCRLYASTIKLTCAFQRIL